MVNHASKKYYDRNLFHEAVQVYRKNYSIDDAIKYINEFATNDLIRRYTIMEVVSLTTISKNIDSFTRPLRICKHFISELNHLLDVTDPSLEIYDDYLFLYEHAIFKTITLYFSSGHVDVRKIGVYVSLLLGESKNFGRGHYQREAHVFEGKLARLRGDNATAKKIFEDELYNYNSPDGCLELAHLEMDQENYERAIMLFNSLKSKSFDLFPFQKQIYVNNSRMYMKLGMNDKAKQELHDLINVKDTFQNIAILELGKIAFAEGNYDEARKYYNELLENSFNDYDTVSALCELAIIEKTELNLDLALTYAKKAVAMSDSNYTNLILSKVLVELNRTDEAIEILEKIFNSGDFKDQLYAAKQLIYLYYRRNDVENVKRMTEVLDKSSSKDDIMVSKFHKYLIFNHRVFNNEENLKLAKEVREYYRHSTRVVDYLLSYYIANNDYLEASNLIDTIKKENLMSPLQLSYYQAYYYYAIGDNENFNIHYDILLNSGDPESAELLYYLGRDFYLNNNDLAYQCFSNAYAMDSDYHYLIGVYYVRTYQPTTKAGYEFKINLINELLSNTEYTYSKRSIYRLKDSLTKLYTEINEFDKALEICEDLMQTGDEYSRDLAAIRVAIIDRIQGNYKQSYFQAKTVYENNVIPSIAFIHMFKALANIDVAEAYELYNSSHEEDRSFILDYEYSFLLIRMRRFDEAKELLERLIKKNHRRINFVKNCEERIEFIDEINHGEINNNEDIDFEDLEYDDTFELKLK